ncbi:MAG: hypothetical protein ACLTSZ_14945 [Lachnospiraceae bacterium]
MLDFHGQPARRTACSSSKVAGMKNFMKELKPQSLEDVIAGISLYRPGPMDFIPQYIRGKNNPETIHYDCPQLQPILEPTYGCIVYQEQVMQIVRALGGYTLGRSDLRAPRHVKEESGQSWRRSARTLFTETEKRACRAVSPTESTKRRPTRFTMI